MEKNRSSLIHNEIKENSLIFDKEKNRFPHKKIYFSLLLFLLHKLQSKEDEKITKNIYLKKNLTLK